MFFGEHGDSVLNCICEKVHNTAAQVGLLVTLEDWGKAEGAKNGAGVCFGNTWKPRSICSASVASRHTLLKNAATYTGSSSASPQLGTFPLRLAVGDPFEQLGGSWWGCTTAWKASTTQASWSKHSRWFNVLIYACEFNESVCNISSNR